MTPALRRLGHSTLYGPHGLRSGWRLLMWSQALTLFTLPLYLGAAMLPALSVPISTFVLLAISAATTLPALAATFAMVRSVDGGGLGDVGLGGPASRVALNLTVGLGIGVGMIAAILGGLVVAGYAEVSWRGAGVVDLAVWLGLLALAASWEELAFRGYAFQWLVRGLGRAGATAVFALSFAALHLFNPNIDAVGFVSIAGASVLLSVALFRSDDLWLPIGLHWGWNLAQGLLFGIPISGLSGDEVPSLCTTHLTGPDLITGGAFGFEGSVMALVAMALGIAALVLIPLAGRPSLQMDGGLPKRVGGQPAGG